VRIGIVLPHIFMTKDIFNDVIFAPGSLAITLCKELKELGNGLFSRYDEGGII
jgi:hypothetical protein